MDLISADKGKPSYQGTTLSKVVAGAYISGGEIKDLTKPKLLEESFERRHAHAGVLSLATG